MLLNSACPTFVSIWLLESREGTHCGLIQWNSDRCLILQSISCMKETMRWLQSNFRNTFSLNCTAPYRENEAQDCDSISHLATKRTFRYGATHSLQHCTFIFCSLGTWMSCRFSFSEDKYDVETCAQPDKDTFGCMWERFVKCCSSIPIPFLDRVSPRLTLREEVCRQQILESEKFRRRNILEALRTLICSKELFGSQIYYF